MGNIDGVMNRRHTLLLFPVFSDDVDATKAFCGLAKVLSDAVNLFRCPENLTFVLDFCPKENFVAMSQSLEGF